MKCINRLNHGTRTQAWTMHMLLALVVGAAVVLAQQPQGIKSIGNSTVTNAPTKALDAAGAVAVQAKLPTLTITTPVNNEPAPTTAPATGILTERINLVGKGKLPQWKAQTATELKATYNGNAAPGAIEYGGTNVTSLANGRAGVAYSDSRFGRGVDFANPSRRVGRLLISFQKSWYQCTATVINKSLLVTAAHCIFKYGQQGSGWPDFVNGQLQVYFQPQFDNGNSVSGNWWAAGAMIPTAYYRGTDTCSTRGVVCNNDVALVWLKKNSANRQIGDVHGWMGYSWNSYSFVAPAVGFNIPLAPATAAVTQLGYPVAFDSGFRMQISTGSAYQMASGNLRNTLRGSAMTGGSSGGPWTVNFGVDAAVSGTNYGVSSVRNVLTAVTSWGYVDASIKLQGASFFGQNVEFPGAYGTRGRGNIAKLMFDACDNTSGWKLKSQGLCQ